MKLYISRYNSVLLSILCCSILCCLSMSTLKAALPVSMVLPAACLSPAEQLFVHEETDHQETIHQETVRLKPGQLQVVQQALKIPLAEALKQIAAYYQANFLYEEIQVSNRKVEFTIGNLQAKQIDQVLKELLSPLGLSWSRIDAKNYSIYLSTKTTQSGKIDTPYTKPAPDQALDSLGVDGPGTGKALQNPDGQQMTNTVRTLNEVSIVTKKAAIVTKSDRLIVNVANSAMALGNSIQLLKSAPFVKVSSDHTITLQGKHTMILIDNKPVADASLDNILQTLPAASIDRLELITHPSAKYDGTYGAVINIITKKSRIDGFTGNVSADGSTGKYVMGNSNAGLTYKHRGLTFYGSGGLNLGDNLFELKSYRVLGAADNQPIVLGNDWTRLSHNRMYSFQGGADIEINKNQTIGFLSSGGIYQFDGPWTTKNTFQKQGAAIDSILYTNSSFEQPISTYNYNLNYHLLTDSGNNELTVLATYTPWQRNMHQDFPSVLVDAAGNTLNTPSTYQTRNIAKIDLYIGQADFSHTFKEQWKLEAGVKYQQTNSSNAIDYERYINGQFVKIPLYSSSNRLKETISGAYGILSKDWSTDKIQVGLRIEQTKASFVGNFNQNYFNAFPTLFYQHTINQNSNLTFSYKRTIDRAAYYELVPYLVFINQYTVEQGNPALKPSYNNIYTVGLNIHQLTISFIYTSTKGMIALFPVKQEADTRLTYFSRQNLDKSSDFSTYVYFPLRINSWWETQNSGNIFAHNRFQGTVLNSRYATSSFYSDFKTAQIFQVSKKLKLEVDAYYWTRYALDLSHYSGFKNVDAALLIDMLGGKGQLRLAGNQILFKKNVYRLERDYGNFRSVEMVNNDLRRVSIGFSYKFGKTTIKSPNKKLGNEDAMKRL